MASIQDRGKGRRSGRWQVRYRDRDGVQHSKSFDSRDAAKGFASSVDTELRTDIYVSPRGARTPFDEWAEQVFDSWRHLRPTTLARYRNALDAQLLARFADYELGELTRLELEKWISDISIGYAPATVHKAAILMGKILDAAVDNKLVAHNNMRGIKLPAIPNKRDDVQFLSHDQVERLADAVGDDYRAAVYIGAYCGLRAGELLGLRVKDLDMLRKELTVCNAVWEADGQQGEGPPKTKASIRRVPIASRALEELAAHLARQERRDPEAYVFAAPNGGAWRATNFRNRVWRQATIAAGLDGMVIHELRHTAVAHWIDQGASPEQVAAWAGHRSVVTVYDRYGHHFPHNTERVMANLDRAIREQTGRT
jgi:integrase